MKHELYKEGDNNIPKSIQDEHGDVVLAMCKICGKGEADLSDGCMQKGYYFPKIEEFHVGFRYEQKSNNTWQKLEFNTIDGSIWHIETYLSRNKFRVKSLDHDDIKEAGWVENENQSSEFLADYILGDYLFDIFDRERGIRINYQHETVFFGKIKNYNKLLDVMEMLGIKKEEI